MNQYRRYLIHFANEHLDFRLAELMSVAEMFDFKITDYVDDAKSPFAIVDLPSDDLARRIASRTILVKSIYHLWSSGTNFTELCRELEELPPSMTDAYKTQTFMIRVTTFNKIIQMPEKIRRIERLLEEGGLDFTGKVDLKLPEQKYHLLEYYGPQKSNPPEEPFNLYFGRWIADGQRDIIKKYHLTTRKFIGNTSMDATLSFVMANISQTRPGDLVLDPFVGSGSLLVACAHYGAYVSGCDIDYQIIHCRGRSSRKGQKWRKEDESIKSNLSEYGLSSYLLDYMIADSSKHSMWRHHPTPLIDRIITDPPYGIREKTSQVAGSESLHPIPPPPSDQQRFPKKTNYQLQSLLIDLLNFAAANLTMDGKLTFWLPIYRPEYSEDDLPKHECLRLDSNCEQILTMKISRRLITMTKIAELNEQQAATLSSENCLNFRQNYFKPSNC